MFCLSLAFSFGVKLSACFPFYGSVIDLLRLTGAVPSYLGLTDGVQLLQVLPEQQEAALAGSDVLHKHGHVDGEARHD